MATCKANALVAANNEGTNGGSGVVGNTVTATNAQLANTINNNVQNNTKIENVFIYNLGSEKIDHITKEVLDKHLQELHGRGIVNLVQDIHFNPAIPENQNIRMDSMKRKTLKVREDDRWRIRAQCDILETLFTKYKDMLTARLLEPEFTTRLRHETDYQQIQQDLMKFNKTNNPTAYYAAAHKVLALILDLELQLSDQKT
jgi:lipopolysaccharide export LptBFGC system permease protein LptF